MSENPISEPHLAPADGWPSDWLRATLALTTLRALEPAPTYGYAIIADLANAGFGQIKGGTLYPLLTRLEQADLITTEWRPGHAGPGRKFFSLTDLGRQRLHDQRDEWTRYVNTVSDYLTITRTHQS